MPAKSKKRAAEEPAVHTPPPKRVTRQLALDVDSSAHIADASSPAPLRARAPQGAREEPPSPLDTPSASPSTRAHRHRSRSGCPTLRDDDGDTPLLRSPEVDSHSEASKEAPTPESVPRVPLGSCSADRDVPQQTRAESKHVQDSVPDALPAQRKRRHRLHSDGNSVPIGKARKSGPSPQNVILYNYPLTLVLDRVRTKRQSAKQKA